MTFVNSLDCCGIHEIACIRRNTPEEVLHQIYWEWTDDECPLMLFSDVTKNTGSYIEGERNICYGNILKKYIHKKKLGTVWMSRQRTNQNSGNVVRAYMWDVDRLRFRRWAKRQSWYAQEKAEQERMYGDTPWH